MLVVFALLQRVIPVLLDVFLIAFIFHRVYMQVRGTRLGQAVQLLAWIIGAAFVAAILQLHALVWLIGRLWLWLVVLLFILYQAEIKQIVTRIAYRSRFFGASAVEMRRFVANLVDAVMRLSMRGDGGALVIERDTPLDDLIDSGVRVEGIFTHELLLSIYAEDSPLRDGAVLLRNRRVAAASVLLPVPEEGSQRQSTLGFRHLSALTLSQETDALIIVVSAETSMISVAVDGKWQRQLDKDRLEELLTDYLMLGMNRAEKGL